MDIARITDYDKTYNPSFCDGRVLATMPIADKRLSPERVQFCKSLTDREIVALAGDDKLRVVQTSAPVDSRTWIALNELLFSKRPDIRLRLYGFYSEVCDLSFLWTMTNLQRFAADCLWQATNIAAISALPNLRDLSVGVFDLEELEFLADVNDQLEALSIGQTKSRKPDLAVLGRFRNLKSICIEGQHRNIEELGQLSNLEDVTLRSISKKDLSFLGALPKLWSLDLKLGGCSNLDALKKIESIKYVELWQVRGLSDLSPIAALPNLQYLFLQSLRQVTALPRFGELTKLRRIHLDTMKGITDISGLAEGPSLEEVIHLSANNLQPEDYAPVLESRSVRRVRVGFGSEKKNDRFRSLLRKYGKDWYEFAPFEFRN